MRSVWLLTCGVLVILLAGCGGGSGTNATPTPPPTKPVTTGAAYTVPVAAAVNGTVTDSVSGLTFQFPSGGAGTLTLAPITSAPARPQAGGAGYTIAFSQNVPVTLRLPAPATGERLVYGLQPATGCYDDVARPAYDWHALPARMATPDDGYLYFDLISGAKGRAGARDTVTDVVDTFWSQTVDPPANAATLSQYVIEAQRALISAMPTSVQSAVLARELEHPSRIYWRDPALGSYYFYTRAFGANLYLRTDIDRITAVHEAAHYMTHILMTDAQWGELQNNAPQVHGIGDVFTRTSAIPDDYAYYLQWVMGYQTENVVNASTIITSAVAPSVVDMPSVEGYAAMLLGYLTVKPVTPVQSYVDFTKTVSPMPIFGLTPGEAAMAIRSGALHFNALYPEIEKLITSRGYPASALAVVAERTGWSYNGTGKVLCNGQPAVGANVQTVISYVKDGLTRTYFTPAVPTDDTGQYTLKRMFFGNTLLRISYLGHTFDIPYPVDRAKPTNATLTIPPYDVGDINTPALDSVTPEVAVAGDTVTLIGTKFGATQPAGGKVYIVPMPSTSQHIEAQIVSWSDTAVKILIPPGIDAPTQVNIHNGLYPAPQARYLYIGTGATFLNKVKAYDNVRVGYIHNAASNWSSVNGCDNIIGMYSGYFTRNFPNFTYTHNIDWNGNAFTATYHANGTYTDIEAGPMGTMKQDITIAGTLDPVRQRLVNVTADLYQESYVFVEHTGGTPNTVTAQLKLKELSGADYPTQGYTVFGIYQSAKPGFPPTPVTKDNLVSYHYVRTGDNPIELFTDQFYQDPIWMLPYEMYVMFADSTRSRGPVKRQR
jgi:hypothetical protein